MYRSIFLEIIPAFFGGLTVGLGALLLGLMRKLSSQTVSGILSSEDIFWLLVYSLPKIVATTLPFAIIITTFIVVTRQSADNEYSAWRSCGITVWKYVTPFLIFGGIIALFGATISLWIQPAANRDFNLLRSKILQRGIQQLLKPNQLNFNHPHFIFYTSTLNNNGQAEDLLMIDRNLPRVLNQPLDPQTKPQSDGAMAVKRQGLNPALVLYAHQAYVNPLPNQEINIDLKNGHMVFLGPRLSIIDNITFQQSHRRLTKPLASELKLSDQVGETTKELIADIIAKDKKKYLSSLVTLNIRIIVPLSCIAFALVSVPMAITDSRAHRGTTAARALTLILFYYISWAGFKDLVVYKQAHTTLLHIPWILIVCYGFLRIHLQNQGGGFKTMAKTALKRGKRKPKAAGF